MRSGGDDDALAQARDRGERAVERRAEPLLVGRVIEDREVAEVGTERGVLLDRPHHRFRVRHPHDGPTAGCVVCLNSLRRSNAKRSRTPVDVVRGVALHQPDERGAVADEERRDAEHRPALHRVGVLARERPQRPARRDLGRDRVGVEVDGRDRLAQHVLVGELLAVVVAGREERDVRVEELVGERVADRDAPLEREHAGAALGGRAVPHRRLALGDVHLVERERHEA